MTAVGMLLLIALFGMVTWMGGVSITETWRNWEQGNRMLVKNFGLTTVVFAFIAWAILFAIVIAPSIAGTF